MRPIDQTLSEMNARLKSVESNFQFLRAEVRGTNERMQAEMARHSEALMNEVNRNAGVLLGEIDRMAGVLRDEIGRSAKIMGGEFCRSAEAMSREVARNTAAFDQVSAQVVDDLERYQGNVGKVVEFLVEENAEHEALHADLVRRVEAIERRLAG